MPCTVLLIILKLLLNRVNRNFFSILAHLLELNSSVDESIKCIVRADTNIVARMNVSSSLAIKDVACKNELTVSSLSAETL